MSRRLLIAALLLCSCRGLYTFGAHPAGEPKPAVEEPKPEEKSSGGGASFLGALPGRQLRAAWIAPYQKRPTERVNITLNRNFREPEQVWSDPSWLTAIGARDGRFPINLWAIRNGRYLHMETVWVQIGSGYLQHPVRWLMDGDGLAIEYTPALMRWLCSDVGGLGECGPLVSVVDNRTNDPTTVYPVLEPIDGE